MRVPVPDPGVDFFVSFHDLKPNAQDRCIYFVKQDRPDRRCKWNCSDNKRAIELHRIIITKSESETKLVDNIREYVRSNCCSRARHRDLVLSSPLQILLVERWLDEILSQRHEDDSRNSARSPTPTTPERTSRADSLFPSSYDTSMSSARLFTPTPPRETSRADSPASSLCSTSVSLATSPATTVETPFSSPPYSRSSSPKTSVIEPLPLQLDASPTPLPRVSSAFPPGPTASEPGPSKKRYNLRPRAVNDALTQLSAQARLSLLAEFHPHINEPTAEDTVAWRFSEALNTHSPKRDFKTGSVYIYSRASSPGFVKIGWTSQSVAVRLEEWSECGYTPVKLFSVTGVPYAQRVETLAHHELIREWRRERPCKGCWERKQKRVRHQEWFEVSPERAIRVVSAWAEFFKKAIPYETGGELGSAWRDVVNAMKVGGEAVTSKRLLEHYEKTLGKGSAPAGKAAVAEEVVVVKGSVIAAIAA